MKVKNLFKTLLLAGALAGMIGTAQAETLRFASEAPRSDTQFQAGEKFSELLKAKTGGALDLKVFPDSSLGAFQAAIRPATPEPMTRHSPCRTGISFVEKFIIYRCIISPPRYLQHFLQSSCGLGPDLLWYNNSRLHRFQSVLHFSQCCLFHIDTKHPA